MAERVIYSSFNHISATQLARSSQPSRVGLLFSDVLAEPWDYAQRLDMAALHPHWKYVQFVPETIERCHALGLAINVWTVDSPDMAMLNVLVSSPGGADLLIAAGGDGTLNEVEYEAHPVFGMMMPKSCCSPMMKSPTCTCAA